MARPQHRRITVRRKALRAFTIGLALLTVGFGAATVFTYQRLNANIESIDTTEALGPDRPSAAPVPEGKKKPFDILLLGSDSRHGQARIKGQTPGLSDTTVLVHVNSERTRITAVSIPRDSMVQRPDCLSKNGKHTIPGELDMFNTAYALGGVGCTQRTLEQLTGVRIEHFAVINLAGFEDMVDAIGGVPICVPHEVNDTIGDIHLRAGSYTANGRQALNYVRERHTLSVNGDLGRMKRQQAFLAAMVTKVLSAKTLANPVALYQFLDAATGSLTTDPELASLSALTGLASELKNIKGEQVRFLTIPNEPYQPDPNRLQWAPDAKKVWKAFRDDTPLPARIRETGQTAQAPAGQRGQNGSGAGTGDHKVRESDENGLCA